MGNYSIDWDKGALLDAIEKLEQEVERLNHLINCLVVIVFQDHFDEINSIWERDGGTPRTSAETWVQEVKRLQQEKDNGTA